MFQFRAKAGLSSVTMVRLPVVTAPMKRTRLGCLMQASSNPHLLLDHLVIVVTCNDIV